MASWVLGVIGRGSFKALLSVFLASGRVGGALPGPRDTRQRHEIDKDLQEPQEPQKTLFLRNKVESMCLAPAWEVLHEAPQRPQRPPKGPPTLPHPQKLEPNGASQRLQIIGPYIRDP